MIDELEFNYFAKNEKLQSNLNSESQFKYAATSLFHIEKKHTHFTSWHIKNESWNDISRYSRINVLAAKYKLIGFILDTDISCRTINILVCEKA